MVTAIGPDPHVRQADFAGPPSSGRRDPELGSWGRTLRRIAGAAATRPGIALTGIAMAAAVWAMAVSHAYFPYLTDNNDEAIYLLQAETLREGHLFPPAPHPSEAFLPWLAADGGDRYIPKYTPVHPGLIALVHAVTGTQHAALAVIAAAAVLSAAWLAREALGGRRRAVVAAAIVALSPSFLIQSATFLSYLSALVLLQAFAAALMAGSRRRSRRLIALAGFLVGLALFSRPFDTLLFALPIGVWWLHRVWRERRSRLPELGWLAAGATAPVLAMLAYFHAATGSPWRSPFTLLHVSDTVGFGSRRMFADQPPTLFTPGRGLFGMIWHTALTSFWTFGGLALVGLAVWATWRLRGPARAVALVAVTAPVGYLFFWGSWGASQWGGPLRLGPFYHLTVLTPLAVLGAHGMARLWRWDRLIAAGTAAAMLLISAVVVSRALAAHRPFTEERARLYAPLIDAKLDRAVVFLPALQGPWLLHPFALARNRPGFDGPVIWATDRGDSANLEVLATFPDRIPYRLVPEGTRGTAPPYLHYATYLERLEVLRGEEVHLELSVSNPTDAPNLVLDVTFEGRRRSFVVAVPPGTEKRFTLRLSPASVGLSGPVVTRETSAASSPGGGLRLALTAPPDSGEDPVSPLAEHLLGLRVLEGRLEVLLAPPSQRVSLLTVRSPRDPSVTNPGTSKATKPGPKGGQGRDDSA
jgi:hypothetical protein